MRHIRNCVVAVFLMILGAFLAYVVWAGSGLRMEANPEISEADFISVILSALGVILAALALFFGAFALFSWKFFDDQVKKHAELYLDRRFSPNDERYAELVQTLRDDARREIQILKKRTQDLENLSNFDEDAV